MLVWLALTLASNPAAAQTTTSYSNTATGTISETATACASPMVRNFTVGANAQVTDVNIGVQFTHSYRGDVRATLVSPGGTVVNLITNVGTSADNLNVLFDDSAAASISTHTSNDNSAAAPPYQRTFRPEGSLASFNGQGSAGTWQLTICDSLNGDSGNFTRTDLTLTTVPIAPSADLSLTKSVSNASPAAGASINYILSVTNASGSALTATGVTVQDTLPAGFAFTSASGFGSYNSTTGVWTVGSIPPGTTRTLTITGTVSATAGASVTNIAEVSASSAFDFDSTPGNGAAGEDDYDAASFTVSGTRAAGTPPTLVCPVGTTMHDWDGVTWTAGTTSGSYALTAIGTMNFNIGISGGAFLNNATYGGQSPTRQNVVTGGLSPAQFSIFEIADFTSQAGTITSTITLPTAVPGVQFRVFDIDYAAGQFADRLTVTGSFNGSPVMPTLTNGVSNYVIGNSAYGDATSADASANGNVVVTFAAPVDTITITYGSHGLAPADPGQQGAAIHDITFCRPTANLTIAKTSSIISDPTNGTTDPKAIPGATMRYCILVTNNGSGTATGINIADPLPTSTAFTPGSLRSGTSCAGATAVEDDNASGADESDPFGASIGGNIVAATTPTLAPGNALAVAFDVTIN
ncbi:proprotein convertase, P [Sphingopyxis sp. H038]|uniref:proprotein convertase P-domain-containing protein n=1 Tax=unclassified Sphingopyxis TaxID=2614943 RepID=UPI000731A265|nr:MULTISPECIES: proprotein convertase P-domain-containing protein [unclassified Sphingopyxis]KTE03738.1 proprotein convertase, P [Sphingopyxis sp. H012]KTE09196.1 proprotein convertase, P [Sphingopyxis sp. H053]KTE14835.1 proprotein convertase, P [Sphingopyxis sp. H093]KTE29222.1 proprotein convertase, P [Sphingopyxis sp. H080]KTE35066.1 proprotein convertase, P [Sphingopyxis sp. H038]